MAQTSIKRPVLDGFRQVINLDLRWSAMVWATFKIRSYFAQQPRRHPRIASYHDVLTKCFNFTKRARVTRSRIAADGSSDIVPVRSLSSIAGTST